MEVGGKVEQLRAPGISEGCCGVQGSTLPHEAGERGHFHRDAGVSPSLKGNPAPLAVCSGRNTRGN